MITKEEIFEKSKLIGYQGEMNLVDIRNWLIDNGVICLVCDFSIEHWDNDSKRWIIKIYNEKDKVRLFTERRGFRTFDEAFMEVIMDGLKEHEKNINGFDYEKDFAEKIANIKPANLWD